MNDLFNSFQMFAPRLGRTLIHSLWEGAAIALLLLAVLQLMSRATASARYLVCCCALVLFAAVGLATFAALAPAEGFAAPAQIAMPIEPSTSRLLTHATLNFSAAKQRIPKNDAMQWIAIAWLVGVSAAAFWHIGGWLWVRRLARGTELDAIPLLSQLSCQLGISRAIRLIECARLDVPAVIGVFSPIILIPLGFLNDLPPEQVRAILAHELAHIRRHDYLVNLIQAAIESLLFYHPATWWISAQIRKEREHCCDDIAASIAQPKTYVSALLALEEHLAPRGFGFLAATDGSLLQRVQRLLNPENNPSARPFRSIAAGLIVVACVSVPIFLVWHNRPVSSAFHPTTSSAVVSAAITASGILDDDLQPIPLSTRIEPGDLLHITVNDLTSLNVATAIDCRVADPQGTIDLPYLPKLKVAGTDEGDMAAVISKAYRKAQIITDAQVGFSRTEARGIRFDILGQDVDKVGEYQISQVGFRLSGALAMAGAHPLDDQTIVIVRKIDAAKTRTITIPAKQMMNGDAHLDVVVHPGDVIFLHSPETAAAVAAPEKTVKAVSDFGQYYIGGGGVQRAGVYAIPSGKITLKQAVIAAGGFNQPDSGFIRVVRRDGGQELVVLDNVICEDLISGKQSDLFLHPNDTIMLSQAPMEWHGGTTQKSLQP